MKDEEVSVGMRIRMIRPSAYAGKEGIVVKESRRHQDYTGMQTIWHVKLDDGMDNGFFASTMEDASGNALLTWLRG